MMPESLKLAKGSLDTARLLLSPGDDDDTLLKFAAQHTQQAIAKALVFCLDTLGIPYLKFYDVDDLIRQMPKDQTIITRSLLVQVAEQSGYLNMWEHNLRYSIGYIVQKKVVVSNIQLAQNLLSEVTQWYYSQAGGATV